MSSTTTSSFTSHRPLPQRQRNPQTIVLAHVLNSYNTLHTLPLEVRRSIYHFALTKTQDRHLDVLITPRTNTTFSSPNFSFSVYSALCQTSHHLRKDLQTYFSRFRFILHHRTKHPYALMRAFTQHLSPAIRALILKLAIPHVSLSMYARDHEEDNVTKENLHKTLALLDAFPALEELDIGLNLGECAPWSSVQDWTNRNPMGVQELRDVLEASQVRGEGMRNLNAAYMPIRFCVWELTDLKRRGELKVGIWWFEDAKCRRGAGGVEYGEEVLQELRRQVVGLFRCDLGVKEVVDKGCRVVDEREE